MCYAPGWAETNVEKFCPDENISAAPKDGICPWFKKNPRHMHTKRQKREHDGEKKWYKNEQLCFYYF